MMPFERQRLPLIVASLALCFGCAPDKAARADTVGSKDVASDGLDVGSDSDAGVDASLDVAVGVDVDVGVDATMDTVVDTGIGLDTGPPGCQIITVEAIDAANGCRLGSSILGCFLPDFNGAMGCLKSKDGKVIFSVPTTSIIPSLIASGAYVACDTQDQKTLLDTKICPAGDATGDTSAQLDVAAVG